MAGLMAQRASQGLLVVGGIAVLGPVGGPFALPAVVKIIVVRKFGFKCNKNIFTFFSLSRLLIGFGFVKR